MFNNTLFDIHYWFINTELASNTAAIHAEYSLSNMYFPYV